MNAFGCLMNHSLGGVDECIRLPDELFPREVWVNASCCGEKPLNSCKLLQVDEKFVIDTKV
jgi:hypothetical protein